MRSIVADLQSNFIKEASSNLLKCSSTISISQKSEPRLITSGALQQLILTSMPQEGRSEVLTSKIQQRNDTSKDKSKIEGNSAEHEKELHFRTLSMAQDQKASIDNYNNN